VVNDVPLLEWNTDKRYLEELEARGVPIVRTTFLEPGTTFEPPSGPFVVKPSVSAGGRRSAWFATGEAHAARALVQRIHADGETAMIQPYLADVDETALVYLDGACSHAVRRRVPLPAGRERSVLYLDEELGRTQPTEEDREAADAALARIPGEPLYARVDLLGGAVLELELTEPSLYLELGEGSADRLSRAISERLTSVR
jgi:glutathione synthase/RimK-type ligase-like ATP-grasp enzyme